MSEITDEMMSEAIDRIARTPDGEMLYRWLQRRVMLVLHDSDLVGALPVNHGERMLASKLMTFMGKGMQESHAGRSDSAVIFAAAQPIAVSRSGSGRAGGIGGPGWVSEFSDADGRRPPTP